MIDTPRAPFFLPFGYPFGFAQGRAQGRHVGLFDGLERVDLWMTMGELACRGGEDWMDRNRDNKRSLLDHRRGQTVVGLGLTANVLLAALKTAGGVLGHSPALLADGVNSTSDVA